MMILEASVLPEPLSPVDERGRGREGREHRRKEGWKMLAMITQVNSVNDTRQSKATMLPKTIRIFSREKMSCLSRNSNPQYSAY